MKKNIYKIIIICFVLGVVYLLYYGYKVKNDIENNGVVSIGKYVSQDKAPKVEENFVVYFVNKKKYKANGGRAPKGFKSNIGKFYKIKYSIKYPSYTQANFEKQVTDTDSILEAGFSMEDIKGNGTD